MTVVVGTKEAELDTRIARLLAGIYQQCVRHVWVMDTTEAGVVHYCEVRPLGNTTTHATHGRLSRLWHPRISRAFDRAGREILAELDTLALFAATRPQPEALVAYEAVKPGLGVLLISR